MERGKSRKAVVVVFVASILLCPTVSHAGWSVVFFDDFDDGDYDGWAVARPCNIEGPVNAPDVAPSPEGYSIRGVGSGYSQDGGLYTYISHPLSINDSSELKVEMRAKSGSAWPSCASLLLCSGGDYYLLTDYGEANKQVRFVVCINGVEECDHRYPIGDRAYEWHDFALTRDGNGWWSLSIDGVVEDPDFYQDSQLTSFDEIGIVPLRNQSEIEWARISAAEPAPAIQWRRIADLPGDQHGACAGVIDGLVYLVGGINPSGPVYDKMRIYDPVSDSWSDGPSMSTRRVNPGSGVIEGPIGPELYVVGGYSGSAGLASVERYTPSSGIWETVAPLGEPRGNAIMTAVVNNNLYAIGGHYNWDQHYATNEMYDRANDLWIQT